MTIIEPGISTLAGGIETVHIIPLEEEVDRAVRAFEVKGGFKANRIYLLAWLGGIRSSSNLVPEFYPKIVMRRLEALGIEVELVHTNIFDLLSVIREVSKITKLEREKGNTVYVNMSAGGPFVSVGTAIATMVQDAKLYYVRAARYSETVQERKSHGNAIVTQPQVHFVENFNIQLPDERGQLLLVELFKKERMKTGDLLEFLYQQGVEGFEDDPSKLSRNEKITLLMRLNKGISGKLEAAGYITKERRGRENLYSITESGKYVACVSGMLD